jgi:hypothetical protein
MISENRCIIPGRRGAPNPELMRRRFKDSIPGFGLPPAPEMT